MPGQDVTPGGVPVLRVLVLEQDDTLRGRCCELAASLGFAPVPAANFDQAYAALRCCPVDVLLFDPGVPGGAATEFVPAIKEMHPDTELIVMTALPTVSSAVKAMRIGARDYLTKPFAADELTGVLDRAAKRVHFDVQSRLLRERLQAEKGMGSLIGRSPEMAKAFRIVSKVAFSSHPVLIFGESGTGKELVARSIHSHGPDAARPFVTVDCAAILPLHLESELFGDAEPGQGGNRVKEGLLCGAAGGTVFLDEIAELPLEFQSKLLRVLQEKLVRPQGTTQPFPLSMRILAATTRDLAALVAQGRFRRDLYLRLNVVNIKLPPLRERREDIRLLAEFFLERNQSQTGVAHVFSADAIRAMTHYEWPGNVRELENAIERACALTSGPFLHMADLPSQLQDFRFHAYGPNSMASSTQSGGKILSMAEMERQAIVETVRQVGGDKIVAARVLGIGKTTLYRKLKEYGIAPGELES